MAITVTSGLVQPRHVSNDTLNDYQEAGAMTFDVNIYADAYYQNIQPSPGNNYPRLKAWEFLYEYIWDDPVLTGLVSSQRIK